MIIDRKILDELSAQAKASPRLRMNMDLRNSADNMVPGGVVLNIEKGQWHSLRCLESGTVLFEAKDGAYRPIGPDEIMEL